ncbi:MAG: hypothetical protein IPH11_08700 [Ignavibacteriales bacterium]|nr:hypothetical protein [Ignavibacteriales bacterium]
MKTLLLVLLPFFVYAQNPYPDTIFLMDGRSYPCLITKANESKVEFIYMNEQTESVILLAIDKISLQNMGDIYSKDGGYKNDMNEIENYISERMDRLDNERQASDELKRLSMIKEKNTDQKDRVIEIEEVFDKKISPIENDWSFGVLYVPYYSGNYYTVIRKVQPDDYLYTYINSRNETNMEAQLTYLLIKNLRVTLDVSYSSSFAESRYETHNGYSDTTYSYGNISTMGLKLFDFSIGLKYYFKDIIKGKVSAFVLAGAGKQFSIVEDKIENFFPPVDPGYTSEDNIEEYLKGLNSPWHFNFGFGAEYFFNESLSLTSNIRFIYSSLSSNYDYRYVSEYQTITDVTDISMSEFATRVGLGLNFYF